jgi:AsmA protein
MKKLLIGIGVTIAVLVIIAVAIPLFIDADKFRPRVEQEASAALGRKVTVGHLSLSILRGSVIAEDVQIADDPRFSSHPFLQAKALRIGAELMPLITSKEIKINSIVLDEPKIQLVKNSAAKWNFESLGAGTQNAHKTSSAQAQPQPLTVSSLKIKDGEITVAQGAKKNTYTNVNVAVSNFSDTSEFPFSMSAEAPGGGKLKAEGEAGPLAKGDMISTPMHAELNVKQLDLAKTGFIDPTTGMAGTLDYTGQIKSDGKTLASDGKATATNLKLVKSGAPAKQPITVDYATEMDVAKKQGVIKRGDILAGATKAKLSGTYDTRGDAIALNTRLNADNVPVDSVVGLLPAFGVILPQGTNLQGGTVSTNMLIQGPLSSLVISGPIDVANAKVTGFNLKQRASAISALSGMQGVGSDLLVQALNSKLRVAPDGIRADDLNLIVPKLGTVMGGGVIGANNALNFKMRAKLEGGGGLLGVGSALSTLGQSKGELPFLIQGTTSNPVFLPDVAGALTNTAKAPVQSVQGVSGMLGGLFGKKKK